MILFRGIDIALPEFDQKKISAWIQQTIINEKQKAGQVFFLFTSDEYLLSINRDFLNHDYYTDIITFDNSEKTKVVSGELYISLERVKENAKLLKLPFEKEMFRVMVHGILHLCGYGDKTPDEIKTMREKENYYLCLLL